jgi:hypothetical protein
MVKQVDRGSVGDPTPQGGEALKAAAGADGDNRAACFAQHNVQGRVVASC